MNSITELVKQAQELTDLSAAQVRTIEQKDTEIAAERHAFKNFHRMLCERFGYAHDEVDWKRDQVSLVEFIAQAQAPVAATGYPLAVLTLGGIEGDEFDSWDLEVFSGDAIDKLQQQLVRSSKPVILNLYAAELAAPQQHAQSTQPKLYADTIGGVVVEVGEVPPAQPAPESSQQAGGVTVKAWDFCPECGSEEIHYEESNHKQCAVCHQEWWTDVDYTEVVRKYLSERKTAPHPTDAAPAFPPRDLTKPAEQQGIFDKFRVQRTDGSDAPGGKHHGCRYFVIDLDHDQYARAAMRAYAKACRATHPLLADDIEAEWGKADAAPVDAKPVEWTPGPNEWKDWCTQYFGPDADDTYLAEAMFNLPLMAQRFKRSIAPQYLAQSVHLLEQVMRPYGIYDVAVSNAGALALDFIEVGKAVREVIAAQPSTAQGDAACPACKGNDADMPCAYPSERASGCLRDKRLAQGDALSQEAGIRDALNALHAHMQNNGYYAKDDTMSLFKQVVSALAQRAASQPDSERDAARWRAYRVSAAAAMTGLHSEALDAAVDKLVAAMSAQQGEKS